METKKKKINVINIQDIIDECKLNQLPFKLHTTTMTRKVETEDSIYSWVNRSMGLNMRELSLIRMVKNDAKNVDLSTFNDVSAKDVGFIHQSRIKIGEKWKGDYYEVDLKQAYWNVAYLKGIISQKTFDFANHPKIRKTARLIALGTLAKKTTIFEFNGEKYTTMNVTDELETAKLFYTCCEEVSYIMNSIRLEIKDSYIFHWVDAVFIKGGEALQRVINYLTSLQETIKKQFPLFPEVFFKVIPCELIERKKNKIIVYSHHHSRNIREFNFHKSIKPVQL